MIFAAGLGTRLRPLTNNKPKALVEIQGVPLLEIAIRRLIWHGCQEIIINIHHFGQQIIDFLKARQHFDIHIEISDEQELLLDTGGGLKKAADFLANAPFLVYNADILTNLNLTDLYQAHCQSDNLATLAVRDRPSSRKLLFDGQNNLCGWQNTKTGEQKISRQTEIQNPLAFSGIHVISPELFDYFPEKPVFSIIDVYLEAARQASIQAFRHDADIWLDVGKPEALAKAAEIIKEMKIEGLVF